MNKDISLAILGAGNIGCAIAGNMTLEGFDVSLAELPQFKRNLKAIVKRGGIEVTGEANTGFAKIDEITTNIPDAIQGRDLIFITSTAFGHEPFTRECALNLEDGQALIYISYFGALRMIKLTKELKIDAEITIAETLSAMYASDRIGKKGAFFSEFYWDDAKVTIKRWKEGLPLATFPSSKTNNLLKKVKNIFPSITAASNVLETSIFNVNPISHIPGVILNTGWIEHTKGAFTFNVGGNTSSLKKVKKIMKQERNNLAENLGFNSKNMEKRINDFYKKWYGDPEKRRQHQEKYYQNVNDAPPNLNHRYLTEDIIYGLVPMCYLADLTGSKSPTCKALIHLANIVNDINYWNEGITLNSLGLENMNVEQILRYVNTGLKE